MAITSGDLKYTYPQLSGTFFAARFFWRHNPAINSSESLITNIQNVCLKNRSIGKVVLNKRNDIMYCSRNIIPASKSHEINSSAIYYGHIGVFVFDKEYLMKEYMIENTQHQLNEDIEWLKILENGYRINVSVVDNPERGIDTAEDYKYFTDKYNNS